MNFESTRKACYKRQTVAWSTVFWEVPGKHAINVTQTAAWSTVFWEVPRKHERHSNAAVLVEQSKDMVPKGVVIGLRLFLEKSARTAILMKIQILNVTLFINGNGIIRYSRGPENSVHVDDMKYGTTQFIIRTDILL
jgi:hypothetical protein